MKLGKISLNRSLMSYSKVQLFYGNLIRGNGLQLLNKTWHGKEYVNLGCGNNLCDYMINIDYQWIPGLDLCWDITKGIPLPDNSIIGIFTEHCIEHISFENTCKLFLEFKRILKPGGNLRVIVPDAELYIDIYTKLKSGSGEKIQFPYHIPEREGIAFPTSMMGVNNDGG